MNYEAHIKSVFASPELADAFMEQIIKSLNELTWNGAAKIDKVQKYGTVTVRVPAFRQVKTPSTYIFGIRKSEQITLDPHENPQPC